MLKNYFLTPNFCPNYGCYSRREPEEPEDATKGRDVFNEKPPPDELLAVSDIGKAVTTSLPDNVVSLIFIIYPDVIKNQKSRLGCNSYVPVKLKSVTVLENMLLCA